MTRLAPAVLLFAAACATTSDDAFEPIPAPPPAAAAAAAEESRSQQRIEELQTQLTELLERLDVMSHRVARLEESPAPAPAQLVAERPAPAALQTAVPTSAPQITSAQRPVPPQQQPQAVPQDSAAPQQRALVGAKLAEEYRQAIILFGRGRHAEARRAFEAVLTSDSTGDLADNALFWIGETYFAAADYNNAFRYYSRVVNEFADQNKAPDALFKIALTQEKTGDLALARRTLQQVIERYPYSSTANSAKAELQRIRF